MWREDADDERPGKIETMLSVNIWLDWLTNAKVEGEDSEDEDDDDDDDDDDDSDSDDDDDDDDDIEALVPTRGKPMVRPS